jgi:hypothetical protein
VAHNVRERGFTHGVKLMRFSSSTCRIAWVCRDLQMCRGGLCAGYGRAVSGKSDHNARDGVSLDVEVFEEWWGNAALGKRE